MLIGECPHCGVRHVQATDVFEQNLKSSSSLVQWRLTRCQNPPCEALILVEMESRGDIRRIFPASSYELDPGAPISDEIRADFREAGACLSAGCYKASLVMSRRALQRCLREQGCAEPKLVDAIASAVEKGVLRKAFHSLADEVRHYGYLGAHPDDDQLANATRDSAQHVLEFVRLLVHEFYEVPARALALRASRKTAEK
jgi:hypothetical protein